MRVVLPVVLAALACAPVASRAEAPVERLARFDHALTPDVFAVGERRLVPLAVSNAGSRAWVGDDNVRVSYHWRGPKDVWEGERTALPADVAAGESVDVVAVVIAPTTPGSYKLVWDLVDETNNWFGADAGAVEVPVQVRAPEARAEWQSVNFPEPLHADVLTVAEVKVRNAGTVTWPASGEGAVLLSYHWRDMRSHAVRWDGERTKLERPVTPGETVDAKMRLAPPGSPGRYILELDLLREGIDWFHQSKRVVVDVGEASFAYAMELVSAPKRVVIGQPVEVQLKLKNTGKAPWPTFAGRRTRLSYHVFTGDGHVAQWDGARTELGRAVGPGETIDVKATVRAPDDAGNFTFRFDLVQENVTWFGWFVFVNRPLDVPVQVVPLDFAASFKSVKTVDRMALSTKYKATAVVQNAGSVPWPKGGFAPVRLAYHWLDAAGSVVVWDGPRTDLPKDVGPGESVTLTFDVSAPKDPGSYSLVVDMVQESVAWFGNKGTKVARVNIQVAKPSFQATWTDTDIPTKVKAGAIVKAKLSVRNDGPLPWVAGGDHPVRIAHHWRDTAGGLLVWDGFRTDFDRDIQPGETVKIEVWFFAPATPGEYALEIDLVQELVTWFGWRGNPLLRRTIEVAP